MRKTVLFCIAAFLLTTSPCVFAQDNKPDAPEIHYHLSFAAQEVDENGKIINNRTYTTAVLTDRNSNPPPAQIRTGDKVPIQTNDKGEIQYVDVGVNIDCRRAKEVNGKLSLEVNADISSMAKTSNVTASPIIRQNRWGAAVLVPLGKPTIIFSSDDLQTKGKIQVELTATRIE